MGSGDVSRELDRYPWWVEVKDVVDAAVSQAVDKTVFEERTRVRWALQWTTQNQITVATRDL